MATYNTGNPIGSKDPRDLYDNSENLDVAVNDDAATWIDRLGVQRSTLWQMLEYSKQFNDRGDWHTSTAYARKDYFTYGGVTYVTLTAHTSTSVAADLAAGKIGVMSGNSGAMDFLQAGTGAVARSVESKLRDVVSVKDFGAIGDGVTDDTAAIQAALDATKAPTVNGDGYGYSLYFPRGTYRITDTLLFVDCRGSRYFGEARGEYGEQGTTILWAGGNAKPMARLDFFKGATLEEITWNTVDGTTNKATACLLFNKVSISGSSGPSTVRRCTFWGAEYGVMLGDASYDNSYNVSEMLFAECRFNNRYGVYNAGVASGGQNVNNVFFACHFGGVPGERGVWIDGGNVVLDKCTFNAASSSVPYTAIYFTGDVTLGIPVVIRDCYAEQIAKFIETEYTATASQFNRTGRVEISNTCAACNRPLTATPYFIECYKGLEIEVRNVNSGYNILYSPPANQTFVGYSSNAPSGARLRIEGSNSLGTITTDRGGYIVSQDIQVVSTFPFGFMYPAATELVLTGGIGQMREYGVYAAYGPNGTFDLATITGGRTGDTLHLMGHPTQATYRISLVKHGTGNIFTRDGLDFAINTATKKIILQKDVSGKWIEVGRIPV